MINDDWHLPNQPNILRVLFGQHDQCYFRIQARRDSLVIIRTYFVQTRLLYLLSLCVKPTETTVPINLFILDFNWLVWWWWCKRWIQNDRVWIWFVWRNLDRLRRQRCNQQRWVRRGWRNSFVSPLRPIQLKKIDDETCVTRASPEGNTFKWWLQCNKSSKQIF